MRRIAALLLVFACSFALAGTAAAAPSGGETTGYAKKNPAAAKKAKQKAAAKKRREAKRQRLMRPTVSILGATSSALRSGNLKVRVKAGKGVKVRVTSTSTTFDDGTRQLTVPRFVRIGKRGRAVTVSLKLTGPARDTMDGCEARKVRVLARTPAKKQRQAAADVKRNTADCVLPAVDLSKAEDCDFIAQPREGMCMLPFPNDYYTREDSSSATGKRLDFTTGGMPRNASNVPIDPTDYNLSDGFSQGQGIVLKVPGIDTPEAVAANGFVTLDRLSRYSEADQRAVVIDAETGERWPIWVQTDATGTDPAQAALMISPARNFDEKKRYIVALRNLTDEQGTPLEAPSAFRYYRDSLPSGQAPVNQRRAHFESIFRSLKKAGVKRQDLYLAWDFTVASDESLYRRALHMRDDAFALLGDTTMGDQVVQGDAPEFTVTSMPGSGLGPQIARRVRGTYTVPCYLFGGLGSPCGPGGSMQLDENGLPQRNGTYEAKFECIIPPVGLDGPDPDKLRPFVFGHGLLGTAEQVRGSINPDLAQDHSMIACATDEIGMANEDIPTVISTLQDLSSFEKVPDRLQQGLLNELFLARLMFHPDGFGTDPAFQDGDGVNTGESVIRTDHVYYMGASQGGIMGGPLTALSPDFTQSALVVGAMNYSTLLARSSNWPTYAGIMYPAYPSELSRPLILNIVQILWDRGEPNGYGHVMTDNPPPDTPPHNITMHVALGDHQVSNFASDVQARTIGAKTNRGAIDPLRWPDYEDLWDIPRIQADEYPYRGTSIIYWDGGPFRKNPLNLSENIGTGVPPYANVPPNDIWEDPHGAPRGASGPVAMIDTFFDPNGYIGDYCGADPCRASDWDGNFETVIPPG